MTEPVDPLEHLDFAPTCEWPGCGLTAQTAISWACGCVNLMCGIHSIVMGSTIYVCPVHDRMVPAVRKAGLGEGGS